jgi:hypothetical protein
VKVSGVAVVLCWANLPRLPDMGFLAFVSDMFVSFFFTFSYIKWANLPFSKNRFGVDFTSV